MFEIKVYHKNQLCVRFTAFAEVVQCRPRNRRETMMGPNSSGKRIKRSNTFSSKCGRATWWCKQNQVWIVSYYMNIVHVVRYRLRPHATNICNWGMIPRVSLKRTIQMVCRLLSSFDKLIQIIFNKSVYIHISCNLWMNLWMMLWQQRREKDSYGTTWKGVLYTEGCLELDPAGSYLAS